MTRRRPPHETVPDFVERQIREAQERGDFDGLAGHGQPLPGLGAPDDELWWIRRKLRDEHLTGGARADDPARIEQTDYHWPGCKCSKSEGSRPHQKL